MNSKLKFILGVSLMWICVIIIGICIYISYLNYLEEKREMQDLFDRVEKLEEIYDKKICEEDSSS